MSLLNFRAQVAYSLIKVGKPADLTSRKRGRPALEDAEELISSLVDIVQLGYT